MSNEWVQCKLIQSEASKNRHERPKQVVSREKRPATVVNESVCEGELLKSQID